MSHEVGERVTYEEKRFPNTVRRTELIVVERLVRAGRNPNADGHTRLFFLARCDHATNAFAEQQRRRGGTIAAGRQGTGALDGARGVTRRTVPTQRPRRVGERFGRQQLGTEDGVVLRQPQAATRRLLEITGLEDQFRLD